MTGGPFNELCPARVRQKPPLNNYYVESWGSWFVVAARNKRVAYSEGVKEFGRGRVKGCRLATPDEVAYIRSVKGGISRAE
jgi:hypothetical protein